MIYLHKILPALFLPIGMLAVLFLIAALTKKRAVAVVGLLLLLGLSMPLTSNVLLRAAERFEARPATATMPTGDAIVVLSGMLTSSPLDGGTAISEWDDPDRFFAGVELFMAGKAPLLIFTGGTLPWLPDSPPEGHVLRPYAQRLGVPSDRIVVTPDVQNTEEEAREVSRYLGSQKRVILVTSAFHMARAQRLFTAYGLDVLPFPVDFHAGSRNTFTVLDVIPSASGLLKSEIALREFMGRAFYEVKLALRPSQS